MKLRKMILSLALAAMLCTIPAFAATFDLGPIQNTNSSEQQQGWATTGFEEEGALAIIDLDVLKTATALVVECPQPAGAGIQFIVQSPANWWQQSDFQTADIWADGKMTFDFSALTTMDIPEDDYKCKLIIGYYDSGIADLGITNAYLVYEDSAAGGNDDQTNPVDNTVTGDKESNNPQTGDSALLLVAIVALGLTACAALMLARKKIAE